MRLLPTLCFVVLACGCQYDPHAHRYTTEQPAATNLVGRYELTRQTLTPAGLTVLSGRVCAVELRADGTFSATNVPPWETGFPGTNFFQTLVTAAGSWRLGSVGSVDHGGGKLKTHWGVYLDAGAIRLQPPGLTGKKPPHGLIYTLGDPDSGEAMFLERAKPNRAKDQ